MSQCYRFFSKKDYLEKSVGYGRIASTLNPPLCHASSGGAGLDCDLGHWPCVHAK